MLPRCGPRVVSAVLPGPAARGSLRKAAYAGPPRETRRCFRRRRRPEQGCSWSSDWPVPAFRNVPWAK